ncbi:MAG: prepilin-type N-terminal cleavage/methylation domain-containing protein [Sulfuricurvum sp.]|uniref:prepilin-type N-terminal cleavage/methylation domain-containing protein n=1 Tax=Sulfuricurvum sp. TaxID=2025608 RepID=UPI0027335F2A|nr:prepilin-type N-terminal cleavage/methylation domain-containing protein [Sulfuricurvum sp.]MDP3292945.1 prepilin-type N-terminal cleavage/methylation domain-containing protein [Sulfuricurvum sp.]
MKRLAFTMIELVFVIVILGILTAIAIPRLAATRTDAEIAKGRSDVSAIRAAIVSERQGRLLQGQSAYINRLDAGVAANTEGVMIFDNNGTATNSLLQYGITTASGNGHWVKSGDNTYTYMIMGEPTGFTYNRGTGVFTCNRDSIAPEDQYCKNLID